MKKILLSILLLLSVNLPAQVKSLDITLLQDAKLAVMSDSYGNKPFTTDLLGRIAFVGDKGITLSYSYELAMLKNIYTNRLFGAGYTYKNSQVLFEFGEINHNQEYFNSIGFNIKQDFKFYKNSFISIDYQYFHRGDIDKWRGSIFFGLTYKMFAK